MAKSKKTATRRKKKKSGNAAKRRLIRFAAVFVCLYFVYSIIGIQIDIHKEKQTLADLQLRIDEQMMERDELLRRLNNGDEVEYIEHIAREKLGYYEPGVEVFVDTPQ